MNPLVMHDLALEYLGGKYFFDRRKLVIVNADTGAQINGSVLLTLISGKSRLNSLSLELKDLLTIIGPDIQRKTSYYLLEHNDYIYLIHELQSNVVKGSCRTVKIISTIEVIKLAIDKTQLICKNKIQFDLVYMYSNFFPYSCKILNNRLIFMHGTTPKTMSGHTVLTSEINYGITIINLESFVEFTKENYHCLDYTNYLPLLRMIDKNETTAVLNIHTFDFLELGNGDIKKYGSYIVLTCIMEGDGIEPKTYIFNQ